MFKYLHSADSSEADQSNHVADVAVGDSAAQSGGEQHEEFLVSVPV